MTSNSTNRFLDASRYYGARPHSLGGGTRRHAWAVPASAADRVLVVLIENGGIDLGLPAVVDKLVDGIPGASALITGELKTKVATALNEWIRHTTDQLLENAELALNRYTATKPATYGDVVVLRDSTATFAELKNALFSATRAGKVIDLIVLTHGAQEFISATDGIDAARIRTLSREFGGPLSIRLGLHDELRRLQPEPGLARHRRPHQRRQPPEQLPARADDVLLLPGLEGRPDVRDRGHRRLPPDHRRDERGPARHRHRAGPARRGPARRPDRRERAVVRGRQPPGGRRRGLGDDLDRCPAAGDDQHVDRTEPGHDGGAGRRAGPGPDAVRAAHGLHRAAAPSSSAGSRPGRSSTTGSSPSRRS